MLNFDKPQSFGENRTRGVSLETDMLNSMLRRLLILIRDKTKTIKMHHMQNHWKRDMWLHESNLWKTLHN